jgi:hypothetical protein
LHHFQYLGSINNTLLLVDMENVPESVEEAAALLGASITKCGGGGSAGGGRVEGGATAVLPPLGMHPAFAVATSNSTTELIHRLYQLRSLLRTVAAKHQGSTAADKTTSRTKMPPPLPSAPSILQVLKKLLGVSTQLAATAASAAVGTTSGSSGSGATTALMTGGAGLGPTPSGGIGHGDESTATPLPQRRLVQLKNRHETPPMWSTPCRILWVDCVVLCLALQQTYTTTATAELTQMVRQMLALAMIHPRSAKAGGGVRIAALAVLAALLEYDPNSSPSNRLRRRQIGLSSALAPWSLDVLQVCLKALRSAGTGEPTLRRAAIDAARATATACRAHAASKLEDTNADSVFVYPGAMEDKAIVEAIKVLKQGATDKFPEIRHGAANMASTLAPLLVVSHGGGQSSGAGAASSGSGGVGGTSLDSLSALEEVLQLALRNIDDEYPLVATAWAQAVSYCLATALQANQAAKQAAAADRGGDASGGSVGGLDGTPALARIAVWSGGAQTSRPCVLDDVGAAGHALSRGSVCGCGR